MAAKKRKSVRALLSEALFHPDKVWNEKTQRWVKPKKGMYRLMARNDRTGNASMLNLTPLTLKEAETMLSKQSHPSRDVRFSIEPMTGTVMNEPGSRRRSY
jgi:hypothetical protein